MRCLVGLPARGDDFFDRQELVDLIWQRLEAGHILLAAPRRFGKTSVMYRLLDQPRQGWHPVHLDAESIREPVGFVIAVLQTLLADRRLRNFLIARWKAAGQWTRSLLDDVEIQTPWEVTLKLSLKERLGPNWPEVAGILLRHLREYDGGERPLIIIDELPVMLFLFRDNNVPPSDVRAFLYWFRHLRIDPDVGLTNCRFLVGGSIGIEHYLADLAAADSFNDLERVPLAEFAPERARQFLRDLLDELDIELSPASQRRVLSLIGAPIPYFIQVFVAELVSARAEGHDVAGPRHLETIYRDRVLGAACKTYFQHYYERLRRYDRATEQAAKALLKSIALAQPMPVRREDLRALFARSLGESSSDEAFATLIADLENDFYVRFRPDTASYEFSSKILCDWWRRYYAF